MSWVKQIFLSLFNFKNMDFLFVVLVAIALCVISANVKYFFECFTFAGICAVIYFCHDAGADMGFLFCIVIPLILIRAFKAKLMMS